MKVVTIEDRRKRLIDGLPHIQRDVQQLLNGDRLFWELQKIVEGNDNFRTASGLFTRWIAGNYSQAAMIAVRRQIKLNKDSISLRGMLEEAKTYPELISRSHYMSLFTGKDPLLVQMGDVDFDGVAGPGAEYLPIRLVQAQIDDLVQSAKQIESFADRRVAHFDRREPARPFPTFDDLTAAIKVQERLVLFYRQFLTGAGGDTLLPTIIFDWQDVFRFAWKP